MYGLKSFHFREWHKWWRLLHIMSNYVLLFPVKSFIIMFRTHFSNDQWCYHKTLSGEVAHWDLDLLLNCYNKHGFVTELLQWTWICYRTVTTNRDLLTNSYNEQEFVTGILQWTRFVTELLQWTRICHWTATMNKDLLPNCYSEHGFVTELLQWTKMCYWHVTMNRIYYWEITNEQGLNLLLAAIMYNETPDMLRDRVLLRSV